MVFLLPFYKRKYKWFSFGSCHELLYGKDLLMNFDQNQVSLPFINLRSHLHLSLTAASETPYTAVT